MRIDLELSVEELDTLRAAFFRAQVQLEESADKSRARAAGEKDEKLRRQDAELEADARRLRTRIRELERRVEACLR